MSKEKYIKYTKESIKKGAKAGVYNPNLDIVDYNYLIGDFGGTTVTLINLKTGMIHTCLPSDIYEPDSDKIPNYLDYDQEVMVVGDHVSFKQNDSVFEITKINAVAKTCNLFSRSGTRLFDIPLSYLRFSKKTASSSDDKKVIELNKKVEEKKNMPKTVKTNVLKKAFEEKKENIIKNMGTQNNEFDTIKIVVKKKGSSLIVRCKDSKYYGSVSIDGYFNREFQYNEDIEKAILNAFCIFTNEDMRKRVNIFVPEEGESYCRFESIKDKFDEKDISWRKYSNESIDCLKDLELGNVYRDAHEARADFYRIKNDLLQKKKQIIERQKKAEMLNSEED